MIPSLDPSAVARRVEALFREGAISLITFLEMQRQCRDAEVSPPVPPTGASEPPEAAPHPTDSPR